MSPLYSGPGTKASSPSAEDGTFPRFAHGGPCPPPYKPIQKRFSRPWSRSSHRSKRATKTKWVKKWVTWAWKMGLSRALRDCPPDSRAPAIHVVSHKARVQSHFTALCRCSLRPFAPARAVQVPSIYQTEGPRSKRPRPLRLVRKMGLETMKKITLQASAALFALACVLFASVAFAVRHALACRKNRKCVIKCVIFLGSFAPRRWRPIRRKSRGRCPGRAILLCCIRE